MQTSQVLDDTQAIKDIDTSDMFGILEQFPEQIQDAIRRTQDAHLQDFIKIDNVVFAGMGASGISGDIITGMYRDKIDTPTVVNRDYTLPKWVHKNTLAIILSYSGNTEETIAAFKEAYQKKCHILAISSNGKLQELCEKRDVTYIQIPQGIQPRAATAYLLTPLLFILQKNGLLRHSIDSDIEESIQISKTCCKEYAREVPEKDNLAKQLAGALHETIPQIYGWGFYQPVAQRWRTQINENSKMIAFYDVLPEANHNDIVGWASNPKISKHFSCILIRDHHEESIYMKTRLEFMKSLFQDVSSKVLEIHPQGKSRLARAISLMLLGDFVSCYLAVLRQVDPTPIAAIQELKNRLATL
jgi:glucose/mannose-6-phosphate isomerase